MKYFYDTSDYRPALLADIGGTYIRIAFLTKNGEITKEWESSSKEYSNIQSMFKAYLKQMKIDDFKGIAIAVPGLIWNSRLEAVNLPNISGDLSKITLSLKALGSQIKKIKIVNDFHANALAIELTENQHIKLVKSPVDLISLEISPFVFERTLVVGCGTGFGQAIIIRDTTQSNFRVLSSECHSKSLPLVTSEQVELYQYLTKIINTPGVIIIGQILSGIGLVNIFNALLLKSNLPIQKNISPEDVVQYASHRQSDNHAIALQTTKFFLQFLAIVTADISAELLISKIYICGGVSQKLHKADLFDIKLFLDFYMLPGRHSCQKILEQCQIKLIMSAVPAFKGLKELMRNKNSFQKNRFSLFNFNSPTHTNSKLKTTKIIAQSKL